MTSPMSSVVEPDPTVPDPVAYWRAVTRWLKDQARPRFETPPLTRWMEIETMVEATTLSELWRSPEWKDLSRAYVKDKACEWCGARAGDKYTDSKGRTRTVGLAPHHIEKHRWA